MQSCFLFFGLFKYIFSFFFFFFFPFFFLLRQVMLVETRGGESG